MTANEAGAAATRRAIEAVWRIESARLIAGLARVTGDLGLAEDLAQDALVVALEQWPSTGIPPNPAGWLMTTAKNRGIDAHRRRAVHQRKLDVIGREIADGVQPISAGLDDALDDHIGDDLLRLIFTAAHPVLPLESRVALTLRCLGGLSTDEIARAFLIPKATAARRIVRAKRTLAAKGVAFELPSQQEMSDRLASVLQVIYLVFNEGYSATTGEDWMRPALTDEALRLGRVLAGLVPQEPEVHGLVALMEIQASRSLARIGPSGEPVLLPDQDRRRWDRLLIRRGLASLERAETLPTPIGPYTVQADIAACHARAAHVADTDWATDRRALRGARATVGFARRRAESCCRTGDVGRTGGRLGRTSIASSSRTSCRPTRNSTRSGATCWASSVADPRHERNSTRAAELTRNAQERELYRQRATELQ